MTEKPDTYTIAAGIDPEAFGQAQPDPAVTAEEYAHRRREAMAKARNNDAADDGA